MVHLLKVEYAKLLGRLLSLAWESTSSAIAQVVQKTYLFSPVIRG